MAESVQEQGLSAGMSELSKEHGEAVGGRRVKMARPDAVAHLRGVRRKPSGRYGAQIWVPSQRDNLCLGTFATAEEASKAYDAAAVELRARTPGWAGKKKAAPRPGAWTEFRGVYRTPSGKYGAQIRHSRRQSWLGTFDAAEDAARAYDDAAVKLHGARAVTNFNQPREDRDAAAETIPTKKKAAARSSYARTNFRGVYRIARGKYGARIGHSKTRTWLGTFANVEEAARAYDAAAVKLHGARAITNFKRPSEDEDATAETMAVKKEDSSVDLLNDFLEMPALDFLLHSFPSGAQRDDLFADLPPAERQLVDGFLNDMEFSDVVL